MGRLFSRSGNLALTVAHTVGMATHLSPGQLPTHLCPWLNFSPCKMWKWDQMILEVLERSDIVFWVWKNESILFQTRSVYMEATCHGYWLV